MVEQKINILSEIDLNIGGGFERGVWFKFVHLDLRWFNKNYPTLTAGTPSFLGVEVMSTDLLLCLIPILK